MSFHSTKSRSSAWPGVQVQAFAAALGGLLLLALLGGALSIVRFRAAIKEPEELAFLFLAITLEHKLKHGLVSGKISHRLPPVLMNGHLSKPGLEAAFDAARLPALARSALRHRQPSLLNAYHRRYFQSADCRFRLTVDSRLQFAAAPQAPGAATSFGPPAALVVLELKFGLAEADSAARVFGGKLNCGF